MAEIRETSAQHDEAGIVLRTILEEFRRIGDAIGTLSERQARTETTLVALDNRSMRLEQLDSRVDTLDRRVTIVETQMLSDTNFEDKSAATKRFDLGLRASLLAALVVAIFTFVLSHIKWH